MTSETRRYLDLLESLYSHLRGLQEDGPCHLDVRRDTLALLSLARNIPPPAYLTPTPGGVTAIAASKDAPKITVLQLVCARVPQAGDPPAAPMIRMVGMPVDFEGDSMVLLQKMVAAIGYTAKEPPGSFQPGGPFRGSTVVLGEEALAELMGRRGLLLRMRGRRAESPHGPLFPTSNISALHGNTPAKKKVWEELRALLTQLGLSLPKSP